MMKKIPFESLKRLPVPHRWVVFGRLLKPSTRKVFLWMHGRGWFTYGDLQDAKLGTEASRRLRELRRQLDLAKLGRIEQQAIAGARYHQFRLVLTGQLALKN